MVGADDKQKFTAKIVAASNKTPKELKNNEFFRTDLYFRLKRHHIHLPPLRKRPDDIIILFNAFLSEACKEFQKKNILFSEEKIKLLKKHNFPGNIRELKSLVFEATSFTENENDLFQTLQQMLCINMPFPEKIIASLTNTVTNLNELPTLKQVEKSLIDEALKRIDGNIKKAAKMLGITRQTLHNKLKR